LLLVVASRPGVNTGGLLGMLKASEGGGRARFLGVDTFLFLGLGVSADAAMGDRAGESDLSSTTTGLVVVAAALGTAFRGLCRQGDGGGFSLRRRLGTLAPPWSAWLEGPAGSLRGKVPATTGLHWPDPGQEGHLGCRQRLL